MMNHEPREHRVGRRIIGVSASLLMVLFLTGCPKPPPPPPPPAPPPPPPPPPAEVALGDLLQELKADPRVQFAGDVTMTDEGFARAVIGLADSFARGNDTKLSGMLDAGANTQLSGLVDSGEWTDATQPIEAVRIVYAGSFDASMAMSGGGGGSLSGSMSTMIDELKKALEAGAGVGALDVLEAQGVIPADQLAVMRAQMEKFSSMSAQEVGEEMKKALAAMSGGGDVSGGMDTSAVAGMVPTRGVLLAIQDPRGAILLGWGALQSGEQWVFTNAPAADGDKPRAAAWDGIGPMGFMYSPVAIGPAIIDGPTDPGAADAGAGSGGTDGGGSPSEDPSGPTRKNTPSGPVTVPGGS